MSDSLINILIRARVDIQSAINEARSQLGGLGAAINAATNSTAATGNVNELNNALRSIPPAGRAARDGLAEVNQGLAAIRDSIPNVMGLVKGLAASLLGASVVNYFKQAAEAAARAEVLGTVLHVVGENAGYTAAQLDYADRSVQKMGITAASSRQSITQMVQANIDLASATDLARAAQDLAVVSGQNSSETFSRLITNIQQMDTMGLRYMGVVVNTDLAYQSYAKSIGKAVGALTQEDRQHAFLNATMTEAAKLQGTYEKSLTNVGKQVLSLERLQQDLSKSIGDNLLPAYLAIVEEFGAFLKESRVITDEYGRQGEGARELGAVVKELAQDIHSVATFIIEHREAIGGLIKDYLLFAIATKALGGLISLWTSVGLAMGGVASLTAPIVTLTGGMAKLAAIAGIVGYEIGKWLNEFPVVQQLGLIMVSNLALGFTTLSNTIQVAAKTIALFAAVVANPTQVKTIWAVYSKDIDELNAKQALSEKLRDDAYAKLGQAEAKSTAQTTVNIEAQVKLNTALEDRIELRKREAQVQDQLKQLQSGGVEGTEITQLKETLKTMQEKYDLQKKLAGEKLLAGTDTSESIRLTEELGVMEKKIKAQESLIENAAKEVAAPDTEGLAVLLKQQQELDGKLAKQNQIIDSTSKELNLSKEQLATLEANGLKASDMARAVNESKVAADAVNKALMDTGINLTTIHGSTGVFSSEFKTLQGNVELYGKAMQEALNTDQPTSKWLVNAQQMKLAIDQMATSVKSPAEIKAAIETLDNVMKVATTSALNMKSILEYRYDSTSIQQLTEATKGLVKKINEHRTAMTNIRDIELQQETVTRNLAQTILDVGGSAEEASLGVMELSDSLSSIGKQDLTLQSSFKTDELRSAVEEARRLYTQSLADLEAVEKRKRETVNLTVTDAKNNARTLEALERASVDDRIALAKRYSEALKGSLNTALGLYKEYQSQVNSLQEEQQNQLVSQFEFLFEAERAGLSQQEQIKSKALEADKFASESKRALAEGDFETAKEFAEKRLSLEKEIALEIARSGGKADLSDEKKAYEDLNDIIETQRANATAAAEEQAANYKSLAEQLEGMGQKLIELNKEAIRLEIQIDGSTVPDDIAALAESLAPMDIGVQVDQISLNNMVNDVTNTLQNIQANVQVVATVTEAFANGGTVFGPPANSTDTVLAWLTPGEGVLTTAAMRKYGSGMLNAMNSLSLPQHVVPGFAEGGVVLSAGASNQGKSATPRDVVDVNFNIGNDTAMLSGDRDQVQKLSRALNRLKRGEL